MGAPALEVAAIKRLFDVNEAGTYLGVSGWSVRDMIAAGILSKVTLPLRDKVTLRRVLLDVRDLDALIAQGKR